MRGRRAGLACSLVALACASSEVSALDGILPQRSSTIPVGATVSDFLTNEYKADYALTPMNAATAYARGFSGQGVLVAVYDGGIDPNHPEFSGRISPLSRNFFVNAPGLATNFVTDDDGHGVHVSGTIAAARDGRGMMGVAFDSTILTLYTLQSDQLKARYPNIDADGHAAIDYAWQQKARILNGSYGPDAPGPLLGNGTKNPSYVEWNSWRLTADDEGEFRAMKRAADAGMLIVMAAGNEREDQPTASRNPSGAALYPFIKPANANSGVYAFYDEGLTQKADKQDYDFSSLAGSVIAVVSVDRYNQIGDTSNWCGVAADWCIAAPGVDIYSAYPLSTGKAYRTTSGTSMAAPHVSGAAAVLMQAFPFLTAPQIAQTLFTTATQIGPREIYGWGLVNLGKAIDGPGQFTSDWIVDTKGYQGRFANDISGVGGLTKIGAGTLELTGANTYQGGTTINGGFLAVSRDANLGAPSGQLAFGGGTLRITADGFTSARSVTITSIGAIQVDTGGSLLSGVIADGPSGAGSLMKTGSGVLSLAGANTYSGVTFVGEGTLALVGDGSISRSSVVNVGVFDISGISAESSSIVDLSGSGSVLLGARHLDITNGASTYAGTISGSGGVIVSGGTFGMSGVNDYPGETVVRNGATLLAKGSASLGDGSPTNRLVLEGGKLGLLADLASPGTRPIALAGTSVLDTNGYSASIAGTITGPGALRKGGDGLLTLSGSNTFTGGLFIDRGGLVVPASGSLASGVQIAAGSTLTTSGTLSGGLINSGQVVASAGRIDGGIVNLAGAILVNGTVSSNGDVFNDAPALLTVAATGNFTIGGLVTNLGSLVVSQGGVLTMQGGLDNQGYIELPDTSLRVTSLSGSPTSVIRSVNLTVNTSGSSTFSGAIVDGPAGPSSLSVSGSGTLVLGGQNTFTGPTTVTGGTLSVNGTLNSPVTIGPGGTLRGTGLINAPVTISGALRPGNSPGTLTVAGPVTLTASALLGLDIDGTGTGSGSGNYSRLLAVGPTGSVALAGTIAPQLRGMTGSATNTYVPALGQRFNVIGATAGLTGSFASLTQPTGLAANTRFDVVYGSNALDLVVTPTRYANLAALGLPQNANSRAVGAAFDASRPAAGALITGPSAPLYNALYLAAPSSFASGFASLSGQTYADAVQSDLGARRLVGLSVDRHMTNGGGAGIRVLGESGGRGNGSVFDIRGGVAPGDGRFTLGDGRIWAEGLYGFGDVSSDRNAVGARADNAGLVAGVDRLIGSDSLIGGAFSYLKTTGNTAQGTGPIQPGRFTADSYGGVLYGKTRIGPLEFRGSASASFVESRIDRTIALGSFVRTASGRPKGNDIGVSGFVGYVASLPSFVDVIPEVGVTYDRLMRGRTTERGGLTGSQAVSAPDLDALRTLAGIRIASQPLASGQDLRFEARAYWAQDVTSAAASVRTAILGTPVVARAARGASSGAVIGLGLSGQIAKGLRASLNYTGDIRPGATTQLFSANLEYRW